MIKKTLFSINYYLKEDFINQSEIDKIAGWDHRIEVIQKYIK